MTRKIGINGVVRDMTAEEEARFEEYIKGADIYYANIKKQREDFVALKASAKAKLIAGEALTQEEADTIVL